MAFFELRKEIEQLNEQSQLKYHAFQLARNKKSDHYNDRKIRIYFENDGSYVNQKRLIPLIELHEHKFGAINSLSKYMGYAHEEIFDLVLNYVKQRRSTRAPITNKYWI